MRFDVEVWWVDGSWDGFADVSYKEYDGQIVLVTSGDDATAYVLQRRAMEKLKRKKVADS